ncbi:uncharacterized protein LOC115889315 [Sitophilus oryzae]|uniref:Uncharacterized protein LOC115889315 n=1 Tax=Sitophilus oryzae TaxID=7048 RepID=A0A6J2YQS2_SITOR|nr:uncharacterized protein LOC115889315 [Sitophilus oryzae]
MDIKVFVLLAFLTVTVKGLPTMYKVNENKILEKDLVPVSSTVIPLPIYKVSSTGYNIKPTKEEEINQKPKGPVSLLTVYNKKWLIPQEKKPVVKQITKKDTDH